MSYKSILRYIFSNNFGKENLWTNNPKVNFIRYKCLNKKPLITEMYSFYYLIDNIEINSMLKDIDLTLQSLNYPRK